MSKPWESEPNYARWDDRGYTCEIKRMPKLLHLCGYITLPAGHLWEHRSYDDIYISVHGGLTYKEGNVIGFDCAHAGDLSPGLALLSDGRFAIYHVNDVYRDWAYVQGEISSMVDQALRANYWHKRLIDWAHRKLEKML